MMTHEDKERDDALIAEALMGVVNATRAYLPPDGIDEKTCINRILEATDNPEMARIIQRIEERQPKPDRAEALFDDLYGKTKDEQIDCFRRHFAELRAEWEAERPAVVVPNEEQIKQMVTRFLCWKLPEDFHPDAGISFSPFFNVEYNAKQGKPPQRRTPTGTNLFNYTQAEAMVRYIIDGAKGGE